MDEKTDFFIRHQVDLSVLNKLVKFTFKVFLVFFLNEIQKHQKISNFISLFALFKLHQFLNT
jgi:hypothetical protein